MSEEIDRLWNLRGLDEEALAVRAALARLPAQRRELEQRVAAERARLEHVKTRAADLQRARRELERDITVLSEQERKFRSQLPAIKKNEEYTALLHEISTTQEKRSELETQVLLQLEEEDAVNGERPAVERALAASEREAAERGAAIDREEETQRTRLAGLDADRARELEGLSGALRSRYERVHGSREGRAVVPILKGACGGCFRAQPPQILQEARKRDRPLTCEGCGRLVVWPPDGG